MGNVLVDDLDNTVHDPDNGVEVLTWSFAYGPGNAMKRWSIDLTAENFAKLEEALAPFVRKATVDTTRTASTSPSKGSKGTSKGSGTPAGSGAPVTEKGHNAEYVREWLRANEYGSLVKGTGRLSGEAVSRYNEGTDNKDDQYIGAKAAAEAGIKAV